MKMNQARLSISLLLLVLFSCVGCVSDLGEYDDLNQGDNTSGSGDVAYLTLSISMPSISARDTEGNEISGTEELDPEAQLKSIDVLVFEEMQDNEYLSYIRPGTKIKNESGVKSFEIELKQSLKHEKFRVVVIANAHEEVIKAQQSLAEGTQISKQAFLATIKFEQTNEAWNVDKKGLPLWGETSSTHTITRSTKGGELGIIQLLRAMARIDITSDLPENKFKLTDVVVYNVNQYSLVAPRFSFNEETAQLEQIQPSLVPNEINNPVIERIAYTVDPESNGLKGEVFLGEASNADKDKLEKLCLVVGGKYMGSEKTTWYRVDFDVSKQTGEKVSSDILRNYLYSMKIQSVSKAGADSEDAAFASINSDMTVTINSWNLCTLGDIIFSGDYFLSINPTKVEHDREEVSKAQIVIRTDALDTPGSLPSFKFFDEQNIAEIGSEEALWLKAIDIKELSEKKDTFIFEYSLEENTTGSTRELYIRFSIEDKFTIAVKVLQLPTVTPKLELTQKMPDGTYQETNAIYFVGDNYEDMDAKEYEINFKPSNATVKIAKMRPTTGSRAIKWLSAPTYGEIDVSTAKGKLQYTVRPFYLQPSDITNDDFNLHSEKLVIILEHNGKVLASKSLTFIQANPAIHVDAPEMLLLDGQIHYTINVKSSIPWRLTLTQNESSSLGYGHYDEILSLDSPLITFGDKYVYNHIINGEKEEKDKYLDVANGEPNLHKSATIVPAKTFNDLTTDRFKPIFIGFMSFTVQGRAESAWSQVFCKKQILLSAGIDVTGKEANTYVLNPNSPVGVLIPIRDDMKMIDTSIKENDVLYKDKNIKVPALGTYSLEPELLWTDFPQEHKPFYGTYEDIRQPSLIFDDDDFIRFVGIVEYNKMKYLLVVPSRKGGKKGNALVGVRGNNKILRTWHIWVSDLSYEGEYLRSLFLPSSSGNKSGPWLDRDLGATRGSIPRSIDELQETIGLYYQMGRKDPFPSSFPNATYKRSLYKPDEAEVPANGTNRVNPPAKLGIMPLNVAVKSSQVSSYSDALSNPTTFYYPSSSYEAWTNTDVSNCWYTDPKNGWKSVFDPCPAGYRVPSPDTSASFSIGSGGWNSISVGLDYAGSTDSNGNFYPITGFIQTSVASPKEGFRWGSKITKVLSGFKYTKKAESFNLSSSRGMIQDDDESFKSGKAIRCVRVGSKS